MENVLELLEEMENLIEESSKIPFSEKIMVEQDELLDYIKEIRLVLPEDLKKSAYVNQNRERILTEAQNEADLIINEAENKISDLVDEDGITREANLRAAEIVSKAQENAKEIRLGSIEYADSILSHVEGNLNKIIETIQDNRNELNEN